MTTYMDKEMQCACCGTQTSILALGSTNAFGSPDLDLRPPPMERDTMGQWVTSCPSCGYCASDIKEIEPKAKLVVTSPDYRALINSGMDPLVSKFRRQAMIADALDDLTTAAHALKHAAWAADDAKNDPVATESRILAAEKFGLLKNGIGWPASDVGTLEAVTTDLWRRAERWDNARWWANEGLRLPGIGFVKQVLLFQLTLIENNDQGCHRIAELPRL